MLEVSNLTKIYSGRILAIEDVNFKVKDSEIVGFVGLNGAGKTTTIKISCGALLPTKGTVYIDGHDIVKEKVEASKRVGWLPEIPIFEPNAKAISMLKYFAGFYGLSGAEAEKRARELLKEVGLEGQEEKKLGSYSQGMRKRFALAASMLYDPQNYLFDEVLNGLDPQGIHFFRSLVLNFKSKGKAVLFSSHILSEVENLADRIVIIHKGKIIKELSSQDVSIASKKIIKIVIQNLDSKAIDILKSFGEVNVEGNNVILIGENLEPSNVNMELAKNGYLVSNLTVQKPSLEEYFLKLVGEKNA